VLRSKLKLERLIGSARKGGCILNEESNILSNKLIIPKPHCWLVDLGEDSASQTSGKFDHYTILFLDPQLYYPCI
jgi:hypothetical protein